MSDTKLAPRSGEEAAEYLLNEVESERADWYRKCLMVQRIARGLPAVFPTALSASNATPKSERVYDPADFRRGMVLFSYNPNIPGTAGHISFINGRDSRGRIITCTNDAYQPGVMDYVPMEFYKDSWGQTIQFAATWLNGYDFKDFNAKPKPVWGGGLGDQYREALTLLLEVLQRKKDKFGPDAPIVKALERDVERMRRKIARFNKDAD